MIKFQSSPNWLILYPYYGITKIYNDIRKYYVHEKNLAWIGFKLENITESYVPLEGMAINYLYYFKPKHTQMEQRYYHFINKNSL